MASTSYNQTPLFSTPTSPPTTCDVFLSFRGKDTQYTFTDHFYKALQHAGIRTFRDDPELSSGEVISRALPQAIQESKTYIVVLSENYATSSWCLEELVEILACYKRMKRLVVPVFYNIDPSVVRNQIESFRESFEKHQIRHDAKKVNEWCLTLNEVADFTGYHISENRSQADIIDEVVDRVLLEINPIILDVAKYPVGLDSRVRAISTLLKSDTEGVMRIGIHGMGGVGKTTLAKDVYYQNYQQFQGSCFLANVREASRTEQGLVYLQKQLIADVCKRSNINISNVDQGIEVIRARICSRKVLIVIDDLEDPKSMEVLKGSFSPGSVIIITTRNEDLLDSLKVEAKYRVNELEEDQSRQLFAQHAFGNYKISEKFTELSQVILKRAGGLPLALKIFGSNMLNKPEEDWKWFIDRLNRAPIDDIEKKLLVSFDALKPIDPVLQDIFLDVACFYIGQEIEPVVNIMEICYTYVDSNIEILKKRCMVTIDGYGILGMHDLLRDMSREIARNNSPHEPGKYSRLWVSEDIGTVLKNHKGTEAIQGINSINFDPEVSFVVETFKRMSKLRFLYLNSVNLSGNFERTFQDLRWFRWSCPLKCLPSEFYAPQLVALDLSWSGMKTVWELNMVPQVFENLKTLDMSSSLYLMKTPDFTRLPCPEYLNIFGCCSLEEVHISIGSLVRLVCLDLGFCSNLRSLPDSICNLGALKTLSIISCESLEALPSELGSIDSLEVIYAKSLTVLQLPQSIQHLSKLVRLDVSDNKNLKTLPDSICNLRSLKFLDISECKKLEELPDQLGKITSLRKVNARSAKQLKMLPDISQLSNLEELILSNCENLLSIAALPSNMKILWAAACMSLERLPNLFNLKQLEELDLAYCSKLTEIKGLEVITSLRVLQFTGCNLSAVSLDLPPNASHNFLAMILCFGGRFSKDAAKYSLKNITSGFIWSDTFCWTFSYGPMVVVVVPSSIFSISDDGNKIELTSDGGYILAIHLLYKSGITIIYGYDSTYVEDERGYTSTRLKLLPMPFKSGTTMIDEYD